MIPVEEEDDDATDAVDVGAIAADGTRLTICAASLKHLDQGR